MALQTGTPQRWANPGNSGCWNRGHRVRPPERAGRVLRALAPKDSRRSEALASELKPVGRSPWNTSYTLSLYRAGLSALTASEDHLRHDSSRESVLRARSSTAAGQGVGGGGAPGLHAVARPPYAAVMSQGSSRQSFPPRVHPSGFRRTYDEPCDCAQTHGHPWVLRTISNGPFSEGSEDPGKPTFLNKGDLELSHAGSLNQRAGKICAPRAC